MATSQSGGHRKQTDATAEDTSARNMGLAASSMACDMLILPEIPTDDKVDMIRLTQDHSSWNPCGMPNVLVLRNVSWDKVMLSLTSCVLFLDDRTTIPVDAVPSTFAFDLSASSEIDLYVAVEVDPHELQDLHIEQDAADHERDAHFSKVPIDVSSLKEEEQPRLLEDTFQAPKLVDYERHSDRLERELEALRRVQAIMDHDSANLDCLLLVLLWIACALFIALVWSGYQLYCAKRLESRKFKILTCLHRKILGHPETASPTTASPGVLMVHRKQREHVPEPLTPRIDNRSRSRLDFATKPITPTRLDFSSALDEASSTNDGISAIIENVEPTTVPHNVPQHLSTDVAPHIGPGLLSANTNLDNPFTYPPNSANTFTKDGPSPWSHDGSTTDSLSPTTLLAQTWTAQKYIRRRARKIKSTQTLGTTTTSGLLFSKTSSADSIPFTNKERASPLLLAPIPDLVCSTPGSADSFVEEFW